MVAFADQQNEPPLVPQVVCIRDTSLLSTAAIPLTDVDAIFSNEFPINLDGIFADQGSTGDV